MAKIAPSSIYEVARRAGVSSSTVSRVLSDKADLVALLTRERVVAAAQALGYRPNRMAQGLATGRSTVLGVLVHDIRNPQLAQSLRGIDETARKSGLLTVVCNTDYDAKRATEYLAILDDHQVAGIILTSQDHGGKEEMSRYKAQIDRMLHRGIVAVGLGENTKLPLRVTYQNRALGERLANHLLDFGHRRFIFIRVNPSIRATENRERGLRDAIAKRGLPASSVAVRSCIRSLDAGAAVALQLLDEGVEFTAVVGASDEIAAGCHLAFTRHGMQVPNDVSIAGWGGSEMTHLLGHPLTTVETPMFQMGVEAVGLLLEALNGPPRHRHILLDARIVFAGSTGPAAAIEEKASLNVGTWS